jgi:hypothetical protein
MIDLFFEHYKSKIEARKKNIISNLRILVLDEDETNNLYEGLMANRQSVRSFIKFQIVNINRIMGCLFNYATLSEEKNIVSITFYYIKTGGKNLYYSCLNVSISQYILLVLFMPFYYVHLKRFSACLILII